MYRVNAPKVVSEAIDDEVIIIHLETGTYFCLGGAGLAIWEALLEGATLEGAQALVRSRHEGDPAAMDATVSELFDDLLREDLIVAGSGTTNDAQVSDDGPRVPFVAPKLERYIDMQTMIQLDPILEVDEQNWPVADPGMP